MRQGTSHAPQTLPHRPPDQRHQWTGVPLCCADVSTMPSGCSPAVVGTAESTCLETTLLLRDYYPEELISSSPHPPPTHIPTPPSVWNLCTLVLFSFPVSSLVSQSGQAVRRYAGKQRDLGLNLLRLSFLLKNCGLWTLSCDFVHHPFFF